MEVHFLRRHPSTAVADLGLKPRTTFEDLVRMMLAFDLEIMGGNLPFQPPPLAQR
jgi:GDP-D-mannose dehydratase